MAPTSGRPSYVATPLTSVDSPGSITSGVAAIVTTGRTPTRTTPLREGLNTRSPQNFSR